MRPVNDSNHWLFYLINSDRYLVSLVVFNVIRYQYIRMSKCWSGIFLISRSSSSLSKNALKLRMSLWVLLEVSLGDFFPIFIFKRGREPFQKNFKYLTYWEFSEFYSQKKFWKILPIVKMWIWFREIFTKISHHLF